MLVTDAMAAMGLGEGEHQIGQMKVKVEGERAQLVGTETLAGSIVTMDECVRHFIHDAGNSSLLYYCTSRYISFRFPM